MAWLLSMLAPVWRRQTLFEQISNVYGSLNCVKKV